MTVLNVPVSIGELMDKITILRIKNRKISDSEKLSNINRELDSLVAVCASSSLATDHDLVMELEAVNEKLWGIEDDIREKERSKCFDEDFIKLARSVYVVNDQRFECKNKINQFYGSEYSEEKSYEDYT